MPRARRAFSAPSAAATSSSSAGTRGIAPGPRVDLAREHHRRRRRAADHRGVGALDRRDLDRLVERPREHHVGAAVVARDHAEHDRPAEVDDRAADLGAVLELQLAHRLGRAVEAREVGEDRRPGGCRSPR